MTAEQKKELQKSGIPPSTQEGTPGSYLHPDQHSFILQSVMEMQKTLGSLDKAVETLAASSEKQSNKIDDFNNRIHQIEKRIYAAGAILLLLSGILSLLGPKLLDLLSRLMTTPAPPIAS